MPVFLTPPSLSDVNELLAFELTNRQFFESTINARLPSYYCAEGVAQAIETAVAEAAHGRGYQFLLKMETGEIVGRANLSGVKRAHFHSAVLGYRIAQAACGKGFASEAVRQMADIAFGQLGLERIEADASAENAASIRVLERNGFVQYGHSRRSFELGGLWYDRLHFERHAHT